MRRPGLWVANGSPSDPVKMLSWRPGALTCFFDYLGPNRVAAYKAQYPSVVVIVRFQHPQQWRQDIPYWARVQADLVVSKWPELQGIDPYVFFCNELNLHYENGDPDPNHQPNYETREFYQDYAKWVHMTADRIKQRVPQLKLVCPPFAFGHREDGTPDDDGNPKEGWAGYDYLADTVRSHFGNIITFHAYWGDINGSKRNWLYHPQESSWYAFRWRRVLKLFERRYNNNQVQVIIDEAGGFNAAEPDFTDQVIYYAQQCLSDPRVIAVTFFLWQDPTQSPSNLPNSWVDRCRNLDSHVARLAALPDLPAPPPPPDGKRIRVLMPDGTVQTMAIEEYLRGVVPAEMPSSWPLEALKAQAVAARSYAQAAVNAPRHAAENADVCTTVHCQAYNPARINPTTDQAVEATRDQVLLYAGQLATGYYSANCGGQTRANEDVWGGSPRPYLRSVPCINPGPKNGHGVGMCQWGAHDMAERGESYIAILKHYYTDVALSSEPAGSQGVISGLVRNQAGAPQPGVQIVLSGAGLTRSATTDAQGRYRFDSLPAGVYALRVMGTNLSYTLSCDGQTPINLDVTMPPVVPPPPQGVIRGVVRDAAGVPQPGRQLMFRGAALTRLVTTDAEGRYQFDNLPQGMYTLSVLGTSLTRPVYCTGQAPVSLDLVLPASAVGRGVITGKLRNKMGAALGGRRIILTGQGYSRSVLTGVDGSYRFDGLTAGMYSVSVDGTNLIRPVYCNGQVSVTLDLTLLQP